MERDLFEPIRKYFADQGYDLDGEVQDIDLYMEKGEESVAVELKVTLDFRAVQQAAQRQKLVDYVYIGIFKPSDLYSHSFRDKLYILKRLGIGLIVVSKRGGVVTVVSEPVVSELSRFQATAANKRKKKALKKEFKKREARNNVGGVRGTKIMTGYREEALLVLDALAELGGEAKTAQIRELSGIKRSTDILYANYYGWFENISKGVYRIVDAGYAALEEFEEALFLMKKKNGWGNEDESHEEK